MRSRSILASVRVAISIPVVLSSKVLMVTNITASTSPAKDGNAAQGKACKAAVFHGSARAAAGCGLNIQPLACAAPIEVPLNSSTMCIAANDASSTPGSANGLFERRNSTCRMTATAAPAASLAPVMASPKAPRLAKVGCWSVTTWMAPVTISQPVAPRKPPITG